MKVTLHEICLLPCEISDSKVYDADIYQVLAVVMSRCLHDERVHTQNECNLI